MTKRTLPIMTAFGAVALFILNASTSNVQAAIFTETTDAGQTLATATKVTDATSFTAIYGTIASGSDIDLYAISVGTGGTFTASTAFNSTMFDTQIFLFDGNGLAIATENNIDPDPTDPGYDSSSLTVSLPTGSYYLGISAGSVTALDANNVSLFATGSDQTLQYGPNTATSQPLASFNPATGSGASGAYQIDLVNVVPEPSTWAWFAAGAGVLGTVLFHRRRHRLA